MIAFVAFTTAVTATVAAVQSYRAAYWRARAREVDRRHADALAALQGVSVQARKWRDVAQETLPNVVRLRRRG